MQRQRWAAELVRNISIVDTPTPAVGCPDMFNKME